MDYTIACFQVGSDYCRFQAVIQRARVNQHAFRGAYYKTAVEHLELEVRADRIDDRRRHERSTGVVEVDHVIGTRRIFSERSNVDQGIKRPSMPPATVMT